MRKITKIAVVATAIVVIVTVSGLAVVFFDVGSSMATVSVSFVNGEGATKALVVYDPGLTGGAKDVATQIAFDMQDSGLGYEVILAGVNSPPAANLTGYSIIIVGGPIYAGKPASSIQKYLNNLNPSQSIKLGVFGYGSLKMDNKDTAAVAREVSPLPINSSLTLTAVMKVTSGDNMTTLCSDFVSKMLK